MKGNAIELLNMIKKSMGLARVRFGRILIESIRLGVSVCLAMAVAHADCHAADQTPQLPTTAGSSTQPPAAAGPTQSAAANPVPSPQKKEPKEPTVRLYMPDGQLASHLVRIYVTKDITPTQQPTLQLVRDHAVTKKALDEVRLEKPALVAPHQEWVEVVDGQQVHREGTVLVFDLSHIPFSYKAMMRVMPVVAWDVGDNKEIAVGSSEVNIGNIVAAMCWTALVVGLTLLLVVMLSWRARDNPLLLLTGVDGHLSLAQTQIACWTVVVGSVVLGYGLIRLDIPEIPLSLLVLMGTSLTTGGIAFFQDAKNRAAAVQAAAAQGAPVPAQRPWSLGDLVRVFPDGKPPELSLAKAQMLFWTLLLLVLFTSKSILDGSIWEVPWPLVALMGFSQAGYLAPKIAQ
jgi:hypothetical protein